MKENEIAATPAVTRLVGWLKAANIEGAKPGDESHTDVSVKSQAIQTSDELDDLDPDVLTLLRRHGGDVVLYGRWPSTTSDHAEDDVRLVCVDGNIVLTACGYIYSDGDALILTEVRAIEAATHGDALFVAATRASGYIKDYGQESLRFAQGSAQAFASQVEKVAAGVSDTSIAAASVNVARHRAESILTLLEALQ